MITIIFLSVGLHNEIDQQNTATAFTTRTTDQLTLRNDIETRKAKSKKLKIIYPKDQQQH
jgi:hypothetical protein